MVGEQMRKQKTKEKKEDKKHKKRHPENNKLLKKLEIETADQTKKKANVDASNHSNFSGKADCNKQAKLKKDKSKKKRKIEEKDDIVIAEQLGTDVKDDVEEQTANLNEKSKENKKTKLKKKRKMEERTNNRSDHQANNNAEEGIKEPKGKFKKAKKMKKKDLGDLQERCPEKSGDDDEGEVYDISSGDEDCSRGMKKWVTDYHNSKPGLTILQERIDDFITDHEERLEQERKEKEAKAAEGGWTVVVHHKGRKKTTDSESGITVGSVAQAAVEDKMFKKKQKVVAAQDFYRFQKREAHRSEIMMLQSKFEQDRKRIQELRAARKFKPY